MLLVFVLLSIWLCRQHEERRWPSVGFNVLIADAHHRATGTIPEFEADNGEIIPGYTGLIAYSESLDHGVLQLDD